MRSGARRQRLPLPARREPGAAGMLRSSGAARAGAAGQTNTSSIFSPGTEEGWLGSAWLGPAAAPRSVCHTPALAFISCRCGAAASEES